MSKLSEVVSGYRNTLKENDRIWSSFTEQTNHILVLKEHRDFIERHQLGFGDRAFHFLWYLLLNDLHQRFGSIKLLEIGVYMGQVISLWSLLCKTFDITSEIHAITPLKGNESTRAFMNSRIMKKLRYRYDKGYRKAKNQGNLYPNMDYKMIIRSLFENFGLSFDRVNLYEGYSTEAWIIDTLSKHTFELIYIDGDHSYAGVVQDIMSYSNLIKNGGYLVMDDAACYLDSSAFWKGHVEVSRACNIIDDLGFNNILNVGHNRVYKRE